MDPLGARSQFVDIQTLLTWQQQVDENDQQFLHDHSDSLDSQLVFPSPFPFTPEINRKIILHSAQTMGSRRQQVTRQDQPAQDKGLSDAAVPRLVCNPEARTQSKLTARLQTWGQNWPFSPEGKGISQWADNALELGSKSTTRST